MISTVHELTYALQFTKCAIPKINKFYSRLYHFLINIDFFVAYLGKTERRCFTVATHVQNG